MTKTQNKSLDLAGQSKMEKAARAELEALYRSKDEDPDPSEWERREVERPFSANVAPNAAPDGKNEKSLEYSYS